MARYSLDPNNLMVQSFSTIGDSVDVGVGTIAVETEDGIRRTVIDPTCDRTCGDTCGFTCDGNILCGVQSMVAHCASEVKAC